MSEYTYETQSVEEIENFPFNSFEEFRSTYFEGIAHPGVDRSIALSWAQSGLYSSKSLRIVTTFLTFIPYFAVIGFIIYTILTKDWLYLFALPIFVIAYLIFHPGSTAVFGFLRTLFIGLTFTICIWSILKIHYGLLVLTVALIIMYYAEKSVYRNAVNHLIKAIFEHEDLLCSLWQGGALNIKFNNGNSYWVSWKYENGEHVNYKE